MAQRPPESVPAELFCATGRTVVPVAAHEEFLLQQHEIGAVRVLDRGRYPDAAGALRRWRIGWSGDDQVHAALAFDERAGLLRAVAHRTAGWSIESASPLVRAGFAGDTLRDTAAELPLTGSTDAGELPLPRLVELLRAGEHAAPLLVHHRGPGETVWFPAYRKATVGCASAVLLDEEEAELLARELPAERRVPARGARLFLPRSSRGEAADVEIPERLIEAESAWRGAVEATLRAARRGEPDFWRSLLADAGDDERVGGQPGDHWPVACDGDAKPKLRHRIRALAEEGEELRGELAEEQRKLADLDRRIEECRGELASLAGSRRTLARGALRLRAERDTARRDLAGTSVGIALDRERAAQRLARRRSDELGERAAELSRLRRKAAWLDVSPDAPPEPEVGGLDRLPGLRIADGVADELRGLAPERLRRCLAVLERLSEHAEAPSGSAAEHLRSTGTSALLLARVSGPAATFPVPRAIDPSGWAVFPDCARIEHGGPDGLAVHYLDDTAGPTGAVHIGYVGPSPREGAG